MRRRRGETTHLGLRVSSGGHRCDVRSHDERWRDVDGARELMRASARSTKLPDVGRERASRRGGAEQLVWLADAAFCSHDTPYL